MCFSRVSSLDPNPDPKHKPYYHLNKHHDRLFVFDFDAAQNSLEFYQTANGSVLCHDTIPSEFFINIINPKDGSERFGKSKYKDEPPSPKKKSRYDYGQSSYQWQSPTLPCLHDTAAASRQSMSMLTTNAQRSWRFSHTTSSWSRSVAHARAEEHHLSL